MALDFFGFPMRAFRAVQLGVTTPSTSTTFTHVRLSASCRRHTGNTSSGATTAAAAAAGRSVWCRSVSGSAGSTADDQEQQQQQSAAAAPPPPQQSTAAAAAGSPFSFSEPQLRALWDSVTRSLLKLGRSGLSDSHANSLRELLTAHKLVKVQVNGATDTEVEAAAAGFEGRAQGAAVVLQVKGRTLLVGASSCSAEELLAVAEASAAGTALWKAKRQMKKAEAAEARAEKAARKAGGRSGGRD